MIKPLPGLQAGFEFFVFSDGFLQGFGQQGDELGRINSLQEILNTCLLPSRTKGDCFRFRNVVLNLTINGCVRTNSLSLPSSAANSFREDRL